MKSPYIIFVVVVIVSAIIFAATFFGKQVVPNNSSNRIVVSSSFYPLTDFAKSVGKDKVDVLTITPAGVDAHEFEPSAQQLAQVYTSKLLLLNGAEFEPWGEKVQKEAEQKGVKTLVMAKQFELLKAGEDKHEEKEAEKSDHSEEKEHAHTVDPHIWLDPVLAQKKVELIRDALTEIDPAGKDDYQKNATLKISQLNELDLAYKRGLAECKQKEVVVSHNAFSYLAKRYNFNVKSIAGIEPSSEPSSQEIANIVDTIKKEGIKYVLYENQVNPKLSQTVAKEAGVEVKVLHSLESLTPDEEKDGKNYVVLMKENLDTIRAALECK